MKIQITAVVMAALLSGCAIGIKPGDTENQSVSFVAPISYQEAYRRGDAQARQCHTHANMFKDSFTVAGNLYADNGTGVIHVTLPHAGTDLARFEVAEKGPSSTAVTLTVWGRHMWDARELAAMRKSIESGSPVCR
jgi:hypothetical protein